MKDKYCTIKDCSQGYYTEKGSKFISFAFNVNSEQEIKEHLNELKKKYHDARHHVFAYILGYEHENYRANDDGEPSNRSGMPVLGQLRSYNLTNVLIVVVRYFGGTKLGIPGLINAYRSAAKGAIENAEIVEKSITQSYVITCDYQDINFVMKSIKDFNAEIKMQNFQEICKITFEINISLQKDFINTIKQNKRIKIEDING